MSTPKVINIDVKWNEWANRYDIEYNGWHFTTGKELCEDKKVPYCPTVATMFKDIRKDRVNKFKVTIENITEEHLL